MLFHLSNSWSKISSSCLAFDSGRTPWMASASLRQFQRQMLG